MQEGSQNGLLPIFQLWSRHSVLCHDRQGLVLTTGAHGQACGGMTTTVHARDSTARARHGFLAAWLRRGIKVATWAFGNRGVQCHDTIFCVMTGSDWCLGDLFLGLTSGIGHSVSRHTFGVATWIGLSGVATDFWCRDMGLAFLGLRLEIGVTARPSHGLTFRCRDTALASPLGQACERCHDQCVPSAQRLIKQGA